VGPSYLTISTPVDIKKGKKYKLSYEIKGPAKKTYSVSIGERPFGGKKGSYHYKSGRKHTVVPQEWTTVEVEFTGVHNTKASWYSAVCEGMKKNKLKKDRTEGKRGSAKVPVNERPCTSTLIFILGKLEGQLHLRNISIIEFD
jgi:hypothetical protein